MQTTNPLLTDLDWFAAQARPRQLRSMRQFAEQELIIPGGPFEGRRFDCQRQPYTKLWFAAVDSGWWNRFVATGPSQSGKTLACFIVPIMYHLFEIGETVVLGLPDMDMAGDKWRMDILPVIERSRYKDLLPKKGGGSRGGRVESLQFRHGPVLKFMSGGGGDKGRAGFTTRVVVITETDGMDQPGGTSREADKITQLEARTLAYGSKRRIYMECTVSTEQGRTWQEYQGGTQSRIVLPCPHCKAWVQPEREHLVGWQGAESQAVAAKESAFCCPACGEFWSREDRISANLGGKLLHGDQEIDAEGNVQGAAPACDTLGFRWSAVNNLFINPGDIGGKEWKADRAVDEENAERELRQFVWCLPVKPEKWDETALAPHELVNRIIALPKGVVPSSAEQLTIGIDLGKYLCHWILTAWSPGGTGHVVDYGRLEVASDDLGTEKALMLALREFRDVALEGWPKGTADGERMVPGQVWIDAGYMTPVVYAFCRESPEERFRPAFGRGAGQQRSQWFGRTTSTKSVVNFIGEGYHMNWVRAEGLHIVDVDADHWKTFVHARLATPLEKPGALSLFQAPPEAHLSLAKHLTAENKFAEFKLGTGTVIKWRQERKNNHFFDALYNACAAAHFNGMRLMDEKPPEPEPRPTLEQLAMRAKLEEYALPPRHRR